MEKIKCRVTKSSLRKLEYGGQTNYPEHEDQIVTSKPFSLQKENTIAGLENIGFSYPEVDSEVANIEAEKGELILTPNNELYKIGGKTHEKGGTHINAEEGSFIFSDSILFQKEELLPFKPNINKKSKLYKKGMSAAQLATEYINLNKHKEGINDLNPFESKTNSLMVDNYMNILAKIAFKQEEKKGFAQGFPEHLLSFMPELQQFQGQMKYGGTVKKKKYDEGGVVDITDPKLKYNADGTVEYNGKLYNGIIIDTSSPEENIEYLYSNGRRTGEPNTVPSASINQKKPDLSLRQQMDQNTYGVFNPPGTSSEFQDNMLQTDMRLKGQEINKHQFPIEAITTAVSGLVTGGYATAKPRKDLSKKTSYTDGNGGIPDEKNHINIKDLDKALTSSTYKDLGYSTPEKVALASTAFNAFYQPRTTPSRQHYNPSYMNENLVSGLSEQNELASQVAGSAKYLSGMLPPQLQAAMTANMVGKIEQGLSSIGDRTYKYNQSERSRVDAGNTQIRNDAYKSNISLNESYENKVAQGNENYLGNLKAGTRSLAEEIGNAENNRSTRNAYSFVNESLNPNMKMTNADMALAFQSSMNPFVLLPGYGNKGGVNSWDDFDKLPESKKPSFLEYMKAVKSYNNNNSN